MTKVEGENVIVIAKYDFSGRNNDEVLSFSVNDIIFILQMLDGGWWEGTLNGKVGWFPSNFVSLVNTEFEVKKNDEFSKKNCNNNDIDAIKVAYREEVITSFLLNLQNHVKQLEEMQSIYLDAIKKSNVLSFEEFKMIASNINEILDKQTSLLSRYEEEAASPVAQQRFGQLFIDFASDFYLLLKFYCENYCDVVELIKTKDDDLSPCLAAYNIQSKDLIYRLSAVFRHFDKYDVMLQEIERNTPELHFDRGNIQRACSVYNNLYKHCEYIRKQKGTRMEFLASGVLLKFFGYNWANKLGECIYIGNVGISASSAAPNHIDDSVICCIAVFSKSIILLEAVISFECNNEYVLKNQISCTDLTVAKDNSKCLLSFNKYTNNVLLAKALTNDDYNRLLDALKKCTGIMFNNMAIVTEPASFDAPLASRTIVFDNNEIDVLPEQSAIDKKKFSVLKRNSRNRPKLPEIANIENSLLVNHELEMILPDGLKDLFSNSNHFQQPKFNQSVSSLRVNKHVKMFSGWCLQSLPPPRGEYLPGSASLSAIKMRKGLSAEEQEDALMLKIVEGYCSSSHTSGMSHMNHYQLYSNQHNLTVGTNTLGPSNCASVSNSISGTGGPIRRAVSYPEEVRPHLIVADDERIFVEEIEGDEIIIKERSLVDTVYSLKDQLTVLQKDVLLLSQKLVNEQKARRRFEESVRHSSLNCPVSLISKSTILNND